MDEIHIPNEATYLPVALTDVMLAAPLASRVLLGATLPGRVLGAAALAVYAVSAAQDWVERWDIRRVDFLAEFGADHRHLREMPSEERDREVETLAERLNDGFTPHRIPRAELAVEVDRRLTDYIASITGQRVHTSTEVRDFSLARVLFPFALGACDFLSGDVAIFQDTGVLEPHVIAHEFCHRKGYYRELEAQALAYLALASSGEPVLVQSAQAERLHRQLKVLADDDPAQYRALVERSALRPELKSDLLRLAPPAGGVAGPVLALMRRLYDERMRLTGQNGISDYDRGFTDFLYAVENR